MEFSYLVAEEMAGIGCCNKQKNYLTMIDTMLKVFLLEDLHTDQELVKRQILKMAPNASFTIASNKKEFLDKITWSTPDIILADYNIPGFGGLEALFYAKEHIPHVPFVFVSATLNDEEKVAESIISGASGYVLKQNLKTLPEKILPILQQSRERYQAQEDRKERLGAAKLKLQKLQALIRQLSDDCKPEELITLIDEVRVLMLT